MVVPVSGLSVAVQAIADFLDDQFTEDVVISVNTPQRASELAKGANSDAHTLNLFVYRIAPSGFHAAQGSDETQFIRIYALLTPFPAEGETVAADADLRILGEVIRVLNSNAILPIATEPPLPGTPVADLNQPDYRRSPHVSYRLQAVMQAPGMEELNHIWTTQGGELAYRLSAAYEFALVAIEPMEHRPAPVPARTTIYDVKDSMAGRDLPSIDLSNDSQAIPLAGTTEGSPPPTNWLPVQMLVDGTTLTDSRTIPETTTEVTLALAGPADEEVGVEIVWTLADTSEQTQAAQIFTLQTALLDNPAGHNALTTTIPATATGGIIRTRAAAGGAILAESPFTNTLSLTVA